ncbi:MAG: S-layer homology domain-containing protein [Chloroflexota bacterium]
MKHTLQDIVKFCLVLGMAAALLLSNVSAALALPYLDPSYGTPEGYVTIGHASVNSAIQADGRLLVMNNGHLTRLLLDGSTDTTFGITGVVEMAFSSAAQVAYSPDGRIFVADICDETSVLLMRFLSNGQPDPAFNGGFPTCQSLSIPVGLFFYLEDLFVQADGLVLVRAKTVYVGDSMGGSAILARFEAGGSLDPTFGDSGVVWVSFPMLAVGLSLEVKDLVLQPDGAILLAGTVSNWRTPFSLPVYIVVIRLTPWGANDITFSGDGAYLYDAPSEYEHASAMILQGSGRILVGGDETVGGASQFMVFALKANGEPDDSFGSLGKIIVPEAINDMLTLLDDSFLVGSSRSIWRYQEDGGLETSFGSGGAVSFGTLEPIREFHLQYNGQVLFRSNVSATNTTYIARLGADLTPHVTFADVPSTHWAWPWIESLYRAGVTGGCGGDPMLFCPDGLVTRDQMAIFLLRGWFGPLYSPSPATGSMFSDVPSTHWAAPWIEELANEGITSGCGGGRYCPKTVVTRAQMAVFLLRTKYGSSYAPPPAVGLFADVPADYWAAPWIEQLAVEGITGGCGGGNYCPDAAVTRAQMAVFLVKAFGLP